MAIMTVYHGGYQALEKPEIRKGRNTKDFGTGFYCTIIKEQAQRWARRYDTKVVSVYDVRLKSNLKIKEFKDMTEEWLDFIIACRSGKDHEYKRLIKMVAADENIGIVDALIKVYNSFISAKIDDYNSSVYYENPSYIFESYRENKML